MLFPCFMDSWCECGYMIFEKYEAGASVADLACRHGVIEQSADRSMLM